jgi:hypothetical protein
MGDAWLHHTVKNTIEQPKHKPSEILVNVRFNDAYKSGAMMLLKSIIKSPVFAKSGVKCVTSLILVILSQTENNLGDTIRIPDGSGFGRFGARRTPD